MYRQTYVRTLIHCLHCLLGCIVIVSLLDSVYLVETTICVVSEKSMIDRRTDRWTEVSTDGLKD